MTSRQRLALWIATLGTAATRWWALSRSFWDWDEALFILGLRHFDVAAHHPHPPGFPLFIASAKVFHALGLSDFHSLQGVNLTAAVCIVPLTLALARELELPFETSLAAAIILAFFPNVWLFGGTAFSDVPAMVLVIATLALLLRGRVSEQAFVAGIVLASMAIGFRPQNALVIAIPMFVATAARIRRSLVRTVATLALGAAIIAVAYGSAAVLSGGWHRYREALADHERFIMSVDSFRAAGHPPILNLIADFLIRPYRAPLINAIVTLFAIAGGVIAIVRPTRGRWLVIACYAPMAILSLLLLNWLSASRFAIGYAPLFAFLVADGMAVLGRTLQPVAAASLVALMIAWTVPSICEVRSSDSPPVRAAREVGGVSRLYVDSRLAAHADVLLPSVARIPIDVSAVPMSVFADPSGMLLAEGMTGAASSRNFVRPRASLDLLVRPRYFEATVVRTGALAIAHGSTIELPTVPGDGRLTLVVDAQSESTIRFNGRVIDHVRGHGRYEYRLLSRSRAPNELVVEPPARVESIGWISAY